MNKEEKVVIEIDTPQMPPIKVRKVYNQVPESTKFRFVPKQAPYLENCVRSLEWNSVDKTLEVNLYETAGFESYSWFSTINKRMSEAQRSSFVDLEQDSLLLVFQDNDQKDVVSIKFRGLHLTSHGCCLATEQLNTSKVYHNITLKYTDCETIPVYPATAFCEKHKQIIDDEWQTVEMP